MIETKSFQSRPELDSSQGGIISKHGHVPLQPDRLHFVEGEDSGDDVIVGAMPYRHDNGVDDDEKKRSRTKRKPRRDPVAADGVPEPEGDLLAEEALLEESVLKDMAPRGVEIKPPRPGETSRKAVYFFEDLEQSDGGMFEEEGDALSVEMEDNRFVDVEEDLNEGNGRISMSQQDLSSADLGKVKDVHTKNEDKDEMIAEIKTGSRNSPSVSQVGSGSGGGLNEDVESRGTGHGHAQREETPERGPRPTKLIILTYMRSGSSYVGNLLERSPQVYYLYEPLYSTQVNFGHWGKFRYLDGHSVSESTNPDTNPGGPTNRRKRTRGAPAAYFRSDSIAVRALKSALDCRICDLDLDTMTQVTMGLGVRTVGLRLCAQGGTDEGDLSKVMQCCRNASATCGTTLAVAVKVIRLSMQQARALMEQDEAVKLLHLLRDPR
ncbi:hypothetical protein EGW08_022952 [Elysia chlorotica]|uniref:Sulfotransferase domain-containing protein n=1 Tax=Elysia chlorotica TaxID=188477 RepID=A0A433SJL0_ELYCH|nr:hypothetical protein EGW08_022952 [Elysia chlorotica]